MNVGLSDQLTKLRIIAKLKEGQTLDTSNGVDIYNYGILSWFWRKWSTDSKERCVITVRELYNVFGQCVDHLLDSLNNTQLPEKRNAIYHTIVECAKALKASIKGLEELSKTYKNYPKTTASLEGIVIDLAIVTYQQLLRVLSDSQLVKGLREDVIYNGSVLYKGKGLDESKLNTRHVQNTDAIKLNPSPNIVGRSESGIALSAIPTVDVGQSNILNDIDKYTAAIYDSDKDGNDVD
jgi:hypothetical protein